MTPFKSAAYGTFWDREVEPPSDIENSCPLDRWFLFPAPIPPAMRRTGLTGNASTQRIFRVRFIKADVALFI